MLCGVGSRTTSCLLSVRLGPCGVKVLQSRSMFSFMNDPDQDRDFLVSMRRETLRELGKHDDHVTLHLPFSLSLSFRQQRHSGHSLNGLPSGLETLQKTAVLEIHNPSARNALSGKMMEQLADIVTLLEDPKVHGKLNAVVLRGIEGWFCARADLRVARQRLNSREAGAAMGALMVNTLTRFRRLPLFVQSRMGVVPGWGGGARLYKIVGRQNALRLLCTTEKISPERAIELKLVDEIFNMTSDKAANASITSFVEPFDVIAPAVSHGAKRVINNADDVSLDDVLEYEHNVFKTRWGGPANLEALQKALNKKK